jgi:TRAP-type uncharacterized transport system substrate-binding protein
VSAKGIDLDSFEEMMNRRLRMVWVRHTWFVITLAVVLVVGLTALTIFYSTKATVMRIAVGPAGGDDVKFVERLAERLRTEHASIRLDPIIKEGPVGVMDIRAKPEFDLAVVRGNMALSADWPVVAILRKNVVALIVPPPAPQPASAAKDKKAKPAKAVKAPKIEKIADLAGKRVGIVAGTDGGPELLDVILDHYGVPKDSVQSILIEPAKLKAAIRDHLIDVVLVAGPQTGKAIEHAVVAATQEKAETTFIPIDQADGIGKRKPPYESIDIPAGAFGGVPPKPAEEFSTLAYPLYLVARKNYNTDRIAAFSKFLYASRQALAYDLPGVVAIESPSTDKDAPVLVHPGTADYLGDNQKTFFDKYGDEIFYGLLIFPVIGSALAGIAGYFRADKNTRRIRQLHRLLQLVKRARTVRSLEELEDLQDDADQILAEIIQQTERGQIDEIGIQTFSLAIDQARQALSEQRSLLVLRPENVPEHRLRARPEQAAE